MTNLTTAQAALLHTAIANDEGRADTTDIAKPTIWSLIKRGYITPTDDPIRVAVTDAGRAAIAEADAELPERDSAQPPPAFVAPKGKIGLLVGLLCQADGATIDAMMVATGWQAHSVRGAISGSIKKALGHTVVSTKSDGGRVYRIAAEI